MKRRIKVLIVFFALFLAWIFVAPFFAEYLIVEKSLEKSDAILILGGASTYVERTQKAAELYKSGVSAKIFLTDDGERAGWSRSEKRNTPYVELARSRLMSQGVPTQNIEILERKVAGTIDEARILLEKAQTEHLNSILIVTSAYHTRRALWTFERQFAAANVKTELGIAAAPTGEQTPQPKYWWLNYRGWNLVAGEYLKFVVYWVYY
jgi:uncharacterized SAM-binding protein YcdF (DUF218 family)